MMNIRTTILLALSGLALVACDFDEDQLGEGEELEFRGRWRNNSTGSSAATNLQLSSDIRFAGPQSSASAERGLRRFGLNPDNLDEKDASEALFGGDSLAAGGPIASNGRTCFTCHRGLVENLGMPEPPLTEDVVASSDALFTGLDADAQGDPDGMHNLVQHALFKYRPNRFNAQISQDSPFRRVFFWRKSPAVLNLAVQHGFLNDGRVRIPGEAARGAIFSHTQEGDASFIDLVEKFDGHDAANDIEAFLLTQFTDPKLAALTDPNHHDYDELIRRPYLTVPAETPAQRRGQRVFDRYCFSCHNTPNVFGGRESVDPLAGGARPPTAMAWAPTVAQTYNIGVSERNKHNLRFTEDLGDGTFAEITLPLANEDGTVTQHTVTFDIGLAATTGRTADIGHFKTPQLRRVSENAPYFHDNSAATLEEVIDYFNSDEYNESADGQKYPIRMNAQQQADLLEFMKIL